MRAEVVWLTEIGHGISDRILLAKSQQRRELLLRQYLHVADHKEMQFDQRDLDV